MIDTPADLLNLAANADVIEDLGLAITAEVDRWMDDHRDPRSTGEVAVDYVLDPTHINVVAPALVAAGWQPPAHIAYPAPTGRA